ncbi:Sodium/potassium-transporting ATPase subunit alpha-1 [Dermatophagoides pteronyssinus]|uniref:Sodium/potassium-transporting ATPase subunit alpha n=1 Tax=Dermatophagoides pteronyssinus TaxID=6956 RepID=A0ABQ8J0W0_DERPT|nr:Sodium/potassium-transporting ATPase subunit alpha-1 [Dermatophagoides pteronyssinus]
MAKKMNPFDDDEIHEFDQQQQPTTSTTLSSRQRSRSSPIRKRVRIDDGLENSLVINVERPEPEQLAEQQQQQSTSRANIEKNSKNKIIDHLLTVEEVMEKYQTSSVNGLDEREVIQRLERDGLNTFTPPKSKPWYLLFLKEMTSGFALLLWFAGLASFVSFFIEHKKEDAYLGGALIFTVVMTGLFSYYQQMSSSKVFKSFKQMTPQNAFVLRNGRKQEILAEQLVIGDIVYCNAGDRIPADIRIIHSDSMKIDNSSITGESKPLLRTIERSDNENQSYLEATNLAFFSTNCTDGSGIGIIIATGDNTVIGDLASIVSNIGEQTTPIAREISFFVNIITIISLLSGGLFFGLTIYFGQTLFAAFILMIGITVGNVPEGLLPALTVVLTVAAKRMAAKNCMVKHLEAVETLGSTSVICTDKTGTLTQNRMTVEHLWFGTDSYANRNGMLCLDEEENEQIKQRLDWLALKRCSMLCSRAEFLDDNPIIKNRKTLGDASETAIMKFLEESIGSVEQYRQLYPKLAEKPFSSLTKYQYSIHRRNNPNTGLFSNNFLVMKGAPERILEHCKWRVNDEGKTVPIDNSFIMMFEDVYREYGTNGERVLAFCDREYTREEFDEQYQFDGKNLDEIIELENLRFLGLVSMIDPPRPDVRNAVELCRQAGIRVVMITGDHPITAQAIAKMCGIISAVHRGTSIASLRSTTSMINNQRSIVIPGNELEEMSDEDLRSVLDYGEIVFARTSPKQKLRVVEQFQTIGEIVAVTGDGVNDSLALKKADIGIAMGITGSEVSKQAADMILLDDNFATIVTGIEEGRRIFDNLKKTISYILAGNVTTIYPFILYAIIGIPLAISTPTALLIALGTDMVPAISLAYEKSEDDIMNIGPRNSKKDRMVDSKLLQRAYLTIGIMISSAAFFSYFISMFFNGYSPLMLIGTQHRWNNHNDTLPRIDFHTSSRYHWNYIQTTFEERKSIQIEAQSAYFAGIIVMQWMDVIVCKTRRVSIFRHGMSNWVLNFSIIFETGLAATFIYTPVLNQVMQTNPVNWPSIVWALPFMFLMFLYEEFRKWIICRYSSSFFGKELLA